MALRAYTSAAHNGAVSVNEAVIVAYEKMPNGTRLYFPGGTIVVAEKYEDCIKPPANKPPTDKPQTDKPQTA